MKWNFRTQQGAPGTTMVIAETTPELYDELEEQIQLLTEKIMHEEERLVLTNLPDCALTRIEGVINKEIKRRQDERLLGNKPK